MHKLALKHLRGSKADTVDNLALPPEREIIFGRDPECHVQYDEADELVSRKHLKIVVTDEQPARYMVVDLGSRNGTFVNRQRVFGAALLPPGGRVQLGTDGPEFEFRLATENVRSAPKRSVARRAIIVSLLAATGAAGYAAWPHVAPLWRDWRSRQPKAALASVPSAVAEWNVFDKHTGARLVRAYIANERTSQPGVPLIEGAPGTLPAFVLSADRRIVPLLVPARTAHAGQAVTIPDEWPAEETAGALLVIESLKITEVVPLAGAQFPRWTPDEPVFFAEQLPVDLSGDIRGRRVSASDLRIEVTK